MKTNKRKKNSVLYISLATILLLFSIILVGGAKNVKDLQNATFVQITNAGMRESHTHDVEVTREAPNYSKK